MTMEQVGQGRELPIKSPPETEQAPAASMHEREAIAKEQIDQGVAVIVGHVAPGVKFALLPIITRNPKARSRYTGGFMEEVGVDYRLFVGAEVSKDAWKATEDILWALADPEWPFLRGRKSVYPSEKVKVALGTDIMAARDERAGIHFGDEQGGIDRSATYFSLILSNGNPLSHEGRERGSNPARVQEVIVSQYEDFARAIGKAVGRLDTSPVATGS